MDSKDLSKMMEFVLNDFLDIPDNARLNGALKDVTFREKIALAYYKSIIKYLIYKGILTNCNDYDIKYIQLDSNPQEDDYL